MGIQWNAIAAMSILIDCRNVSILFLPKIRKYLTIPSTVTSKIIRRPALSITTKLTNVKMKLVAPTTMATAVGLLKPTRENRVAE